MDILKNVISSLVLEKKLKELKDSWKEGDLYNDSKNFKFPWVSFNPKYGIRADIK